MTDADIYRQQGFGHSLGWPARPALLIVDFVNGFVDPAVFGGGNIAEAVEATVPVLAAARAAGLPIAFTRIVYADDGSDAGLWCEKVPALRGLTEAAETSRVVDRLAPRPGEYVLRKTQASAFFGTDLAPWLVARGADGVVVAGATTSGCVRATVIDAMSHNYRTVVLSDCVGDRARGPHEANLFDMGQKYADLLTGSEAVSALVAAAPR
ncbi:isochorismatase family protein [Paralimibaculum aggregatum]|uniref:Isochorismatase family protein n=1 Tax=Paralimibaculum aggregatum TaxID=3036245 RepID=A0ABQ6LFM4_9RHOB|nr:isochorismatase family protein [Limibaculum sp. NKW23]GMG82126.1 isochorismatase family protein [Limibaculum sp. NKW23]